VAARSTYCCSGAGGSAVVAESSQLTRGIAAGVRAPPVIAQRRIPAGFVAHGTKLYAVVAWGPFPPPQLVIAVAIEVVEEFPEGQAKFVARDPRSVVRIKQGEQFVICHEVEVIPIRLVADEWHQLWTRQVPELPSQRRLLVHPLVRGERRSPAHLTHRTALAREMGVVEVTGQDRVLPTNQCGCRGHQSWPVWRLKGDWRMLAWATPLPRSGSVGRVGWFSRGRSLGAPTARARLVK
jgi:hypothetical protein